MHQNIKNNYTRKLDAKLYNGKYYDFMLFKGETINQSLSDIEDMSIVDFTNFYIENGKLYSETTWADAVNNGVLLKDIGMTGVDNGFYVFDKSAITNEEFLNLYFHSEYSIESGDTRFFMTPISGNTQEHTYDMEIVEEEDLKYLKLNGGFYQGFFKLEGFEYQVFPSNINNDIVLHFDLRPRSDYQQKENTVNNKHPENSGIFFFIGARAENKFADYYNDEYSPIEPVCNPYDNIENDGYFLDDNYLSNNDADVMKDDFTDSEGDLIEKDNLIEFETDNKFIFFNRTKEGFTTETWPGDDTIIKIKMEKHENINYFPYLNRTETGYTVDNIYELEDEYIKEQKEQGIEEYDIYKDIRDNVFALRITPEGAIGYKYGILDCDSEEGHYSVVEEYSKDGMVHTDEWNSINVRFAILNPTNDKCDKRQRKMKIMIYVNGYLKFISKELNALSFKALNDNYRKQEGVPYNISLGGGALGLMEMITPRYYDVPSKILPIERDFCGSFIGDIKSFKIYQGFIDYYAIKNYLS